MRSLLKTKKMPLHFKIKRSTLVCPGERGKTKANLIQDSHIVDEGSWPGYGNGNECYPCISKNGKVTFKWLDFHLFQIFVWLPPVILFMGIYIFDPQKPKPDGMKTVSEKAFLQSSGRNRICSEEPEDCVLLGNGRTDFVSWTQLWKCGLRLLRAWFRATRAFSSSTVLTFPGKQTQVV